MNQPEPWYAHAFSVLAVCCVVLLAFQRVEGFAVGIAYNVGLIWYLVHRKGLKSQLWMYLAFIVSNLWGIVYWRMT